MSFRATTDLRDKLSKAASEAGRSLTQEIERRLERSFDQGGMVTSDIETIVERAVARALEQVLSPKGREAEQPQAAAELPDREKRILELLIAGASNREIAQKLGISVEALKAEIGTILRTIKAANQAQAIIWARQHLNPANDFMHEAQQYQAPPKTAHKARVPARAKA